MRGLIFSILLLTAQPAFGLLPPLFQSVREIEAIVSSEDLKVKIPPSQPIHALTKVEKGYILETQDYQMAIDVVYKQQATPGPMQFELIFKEPTRVVPKR